MSSRRVVILVASIGVALLAGVGLLTYVNNSGGSGGGGGGETATVYVAAQGIAEDATGESAKASFNLIELGSDVIPPDALRSESQLEQLDGLVARGPVEQGQFITRSMFVAPSTKSSSETASKELVDPQNVLISIPSGELRGVGSLIEPGDYVNLYLKTLELEPTALDANGNPTQLAATDDFFVGAYGRPLYQKARVAAVGQDTGTPDPDNPVDPAEAEQAYDTITLEVSPEAAQYIVTVLDFDEQDRTFHLALVSPDYEPIEPLENDELKELPIEFVPYRDNVDISSGEVAPEATNDGNDTEEDSAVEPEETPDEEEGAAGTNDADDVVEPLNRTTDEDLAETPDGLVTEESTEDEPNGLAEFVTDGGDSDEASEEG